MIWRCTSTKWFFVYLIPGRTGIFLRRGENLSEQSREATTNSNQILWRRSRDLVGGERSHQYIYNLNFYHFLIFAVGKPEVITN